MKRKIIFSFLSVFIMVSLVCATIAFKNPEPAKSKAIQVWQYSSTEPLSNAKIAAKYTNITGGGGYSCSGSGNVCTVSFNTGDYPNLQAYLNSFSTPSDVKNASNTVQRN